MADAPKYSDQDVRDIIERALSAQGDSGAGVSHGDLLAIGEQVGISPEAMTRAAREVERARLDQSAASAVKSRRRRWLALHAALYAVLNGLLFSVNALTTPGEWWALFPIVIWGLALMLHASAALGLGVSSRALTKERAKQQSLRLAGASGKLRVAGEAQAAVPEPDLPAAEAADAPVKLTR